MFIWDMEQIGKKGISGKNKRNSFFSCEAFAILQALIHIKKNSGNKWTTFSDSLSVISNLQNDGLDSKINPYISENTEIAHYLWTKNNVKVTFA